MPSVVDAAGVEDGDIVFHRSQSRQAGAIAAATHSHYTHMGIVFISDGKPFVYEAVQPVKRTPLDEWTKRGVDERIVVKRLKDRSMIDMAEVHKHAKAFLGKDYGSSFDWSDDRIYCSELVWKAYNRAAGIEIGSLKKLRNFDLSSQLVRQMLQERYGETIPLDMDVISPACMFNSELLMTVE